MALLSRLDPAVPEDNMIYHPKALSYPSHIATSGSELDPCACTLEFSPSVPNQLLQLLRPKNLLKKAKLTAGLTSQFEDKRCLSSQIQIWPLGLLFASDRLGLTQLQAPGRGPGAPDGLSGKQRCSGQLLLISQSLIPDNSSHAGWQEREKDVS